MLNVADWNGILTKNDLFRKLNWICVPHIFYLRLVFTFGKFTFNFIWYTMCAISARMLVTMRLRNKIKYTPEMFILCHSLILYNGFCLVCFSCNGSILSAKHLFNVPSMSLQFNNQCLSDRKSFERVDYLIYLPF